MTIATESISARTLVSAPLFDRLVHRIACTERLPRAFAVRIMDQALAFLAACAADPGSRLSPSALVDVGWHTFLLHTREYIEFCDRGRGRLHPPCAGRRRGPSRRVRSGPAD